jgi:16S rRNA (cytosine967-C5)-methyltransferase
MLDRWRDWLGDGECRALALTNNSPAEHAFRVNTLRITAEDALEELRSAGLTIRESTLSPGGFVVEEGPGSAIAQAADRGLVFIQDQASQLISLLIEPEPKQRVLDLCAAPGSKSSHIAALTGDEAWILAGDLHAHRLATLRSTCDRLGIRSIDLVALDAASALPFDEAVGFDRVLVDAPCSGTGTLRGNPEIKWRLALEDIIGLSKLQLTLLRNASSLVAPGGRLLYSTCSLEQEENEQVISQFLTESHLFRVVQPNARADLITGDGFVRTFPHRHCTDGFFAAVLEKIR